ncbi:hypothetical protein [Nocardiopsis synnemataformans]|uniref:hypothetical protein n=1 Tax=Nocardiopsis synnemataformans TaxID=61305 RepID=UPI003EBF074B
MFDEQARQFSDRVWRSLSHAYPEADPELRKLSPEQASEYIKVYENSEPEVKERAQEEALAWNEWHSTQLTFVIDTLTTQNEDAKDYNWRMAAIAWVGLGLGIASALFSVWAYLNPLQP